MWHRSRRVRGIRQRFAQVFNQIKPLVESSIVFSEDHAEEVVAILVAVCGAGVIVAVIVLGVAQVIVLAVAGAAVIAVASATVHGARVLLRWLQDERARRVARTRTGRAAQSTDAAAAVREAATAAQAGECNGAQNQDAESESGQPEDS